MKGQVVSINHMYMSYGDDFVLEDINVSIEHNKITAIVGPNGAGKSTFLKGVLNIMQLHSGSITFQGKSFHKVRNQIAYVPQSSSVNWDFPVTVLDVVLMGRYQHIKFWQRIGKSDKKKALEALKKVGMEEYRDRQISRLSGGQKQRVFLARAMCQDAQIYFMDEPLQGVDVKTEKVLVDILKYFKKMGKTIVLVHHDLSTVSEYFDQVILLNKHLIKAGDIKTSFTSRFINQTYGGNIGDVYGV